MKIICTKEFRRIWSRKCRKNCLKEWCKIKITMLLLLTMLFLINYISLWTLFLGQIIKEGLRRKFQLTKTKIKTKLIKIKITIIFNNKKAIIRGPNYLAKDLIFWETEIVWMKPEMEIVIVKSNVFNKCNNKMMKKMKGG